MDICAPVKSNIVLIGMPGSGKSTVGAILAKLTSLNFLDTDILIQTREKRSLQEIVDTEGYMVLRGIEERMLLALTCKGHVIATGGSAVYSNSAMERLRSDGIIVFLDADIGTLLSRVRDFSTRGLAKRPDQTFADLFEERVALYTKYADITISTSGLNHEDVCKEIIGRLRSWTGR
jgi:shikimate kinase